MPTSETARGPASLARGHPYLLTRVAARTHAPSRTPAKRRRPVHRPAGPGRAGTAPPTSARERFRGLDQYRVEREWRRYEGTPQRELFLELRERFLARHRAPRGWTIDVGSGPGRFTPKIGGPDSPVVGLDLSREMLREGRRRVRGARPTVWVRGDALHAPFRAGRFSEVVVLGNALGFSGSEARSAFQAVASLVGPGGRLLVESVAGTGERSRYLGRLPPGAVRRLLAAPANLVKSRIEREGFRPEPEPSTLSKERFRRLDPATLEEWVLAEGLHVEERVAVAPLLGADPDRIAAVRPDPAAWRRLLELEELVGRSAPRWENAAALLLAARRPE